MKLHSLSRKLIAAVASVAMLAAPPYRSSCRSCTEQRHPGMG